MTESTQAENAAVPETPASSRARELLNSMKEKREKFTVKVQQNPGDQMSPNATASPNSNGSNFESTSIAQKLMRDSLRDRRQRLAKLSQKNDNLKMLRFSVPSPSLSERSTQTAATEESTTASSDSDQYPISLASDNTPLIAEAEKELKEALKSEDTAIPEDSHHSEFSAANNERCLSPVREEDESSQAPIPKVISSHALNHDPASLVPNIPPSIVVSPTSLLDKPERESRLVTLTEVVDCPSPVLAEALMRSVTPTETTMATEEPELMATPEGRSEYLNHLYQPSPENSPNSTKYWRKRSMHKRVRQSTGNTKQLLDVVLVDDHDARRKLLKALQSDVKSIHAAYVELETADVTIPALDHTLVSDDDDDSSSSDASSEALTTDSDTSGWLSSGESVGSNTASPPQTQTPKQPSLLQMDVNTTPETAYADDDEASADLSLLSAVMIVPTEEEKEQDILQDPILFVERYTAEQIRLGGLYGIALASGWDESASIRIQTVPDTPRAPTFATKDTHCGAQGSLYDLCQKSGANIPVLPPPVERPVVAQNHARAYRPNLRVQINFGTRYICQGGHYDIAKKSGLTDEAMRSKDSFNINARPRKQSLGSAGIRPEGDTDVRCGAWGTLATFGVQAR